MRAETKARTKTRMPAEARTRAAYTGVKERAERAARMLARSRLRRRGIWTVKLALMALAVAIVGLMFVWPRWALDDHRVRLDPGTRVARPELRDELRVTNPRYVGTDAQDHAYVLTADLAIEQSGGGKIYLSAPKMDVDAAAGWTAVMAESGVFERATRQLELRGEVAMFRGEGPELHADSVYIDLASRDSWAVTPVTGQSPAMAFSGEGFRTSHQGMRLHLTGKSQISLHGGGQADRMAQPAQDQPAQGGQ